jgi:OOP family OmpA-OmpF porin
MKSRTLAAAIAAAGLLATATPSFAQQAYLGASAGPSKIYLDCDGAITCDETDTGFKVYGGYMFTPNIGIELAYADLGSASATALVSGRRVIATLDGSAVSATAVLAAPLSDSFSLFARLGFASVDAKLSGSVAGLGSASDTESNASVAYGIGAAVHVTKNIAVRGEWERYRAKYDGEEADVDLFSVGVKFRF